MKTFIVKMTEEEFNEMKYQTLKDLPAEEQGEWKDSEVLESSINYNVSNVEEVV